MILSANRAHSAQQGVSFFFFFFVPLAGHARVRVRRLLGLTAKRVRVHARGGEWGRGTVHCMIMHDNILFIYITALSESWLRLKQPRGKIESPSVGLRATNDGCWWYSLTNSFPFHGPWAVGCGVGRCEEAWHKLEMDTARSSICQKTFLRLWIGGLQLIG